jgi:hypothetical protein
MPQWRTGRRRDGSTYHYPINQSRYGKRIGRDVIGYAPSIRIHVHPKLLSFSDYIKTTGIAMLKNALIYGLSAAVPAFGAFAIPLYSASSYLGLGASLCRIYDELVSKKKFDQESVGEVSEQLGESATQGSADEIASKIVARAGDRGLFKEITKRTRVDGVVFSEMLKGSISSALSTSGGEFAKFVIGKMVGA